MIGFTGSGLKWREKKYLWSPQSRKLNFGENHRNDKTRGNIFQTGSNQQAWWEIPSIYFYLRLGLSPSPLAGSALVCRVDTLSGHAFKTGPFRFWFYHLLGTAIMCKYPSTRPVFRLFFDGEYVFMRNLLKHQICRIEVTFISSNFFQYKFSTVYRMLDFSQHVVEVI